jgi:hypothetical protein
MRRAIPGLLIVLLVSTQANANQLATDFSSAGSYGGSVWNLGFEFQVNTTVTAVALGNVDSVYLSGSGFPQPQQVGLWTSGGVLLASTYVDDSDTLVNGHWRFSSIAPVTLLAGQTYVVGAQGGAAYTGAGLTNGLTVDPDITYIEDLYSDVGTSNNPLVFPSATENQTIASGGGWYGANIEFGTSPVPEPASLTLFAVGGLSLMGCAFRRRRTVA